MDEHAFLSYLPQMIGVVCVVSFNIYRYYFRRDPDAIPEEPVVERHRTDSFLDRFNKRLYSIIKKHDENKTDH